MRINLAPPPSSAGQPHRWMSAFLSLIPCLVFALPASAQNFQAAYDLKSVSGADAAQVLAYGKTALDSFGRTVRTGDINGDGIADLIVGATGADVGAPIRTDAGSVLVWFGGAGLAGIHDVAGLIGSVPDVTILGASALDQLSSGGALAAADVNADGIDDLVIGSFAGDGPGNARNNAGEVYIVFGRTTMPATVDLAIQGSGGADVTLFGASPDDNLTTGGALVAADVNGDGIADVIAGSPLADGAAESRLSSGEAFVILGRATFPTTLDLSIQGSGGADVTLYGPNANDFLTFGGAITVGDVNGDGISDLLLGALGGDGPAEARTSAGEAFVVFGRASFPAAMQLEVRGSGGASVTIWGATASDQLTSGGTLAVGDFDGDGMPDIVVGAVGADGAGESRNGSGEVYVIRGRATFPETIDVSLTGADGCDLTLFGATAADNLTSGGALALGDVNRDGVSDLVLGSPLADGPGESRSSAGEAYIVYGGTRTGSAVDLGATDGTGASVVIYGASAGDNLGIGGALTLADIDGNAFADVILGAPSADGPLESRLSAGEVYLVRGRPGLPAAVDLNAPGSLASTLYGATSSDQITSGGALAAGDVNGDGLDDVIVGLNNGDGPAEARTNAGEVNVLFGVAVPELDVAQPADVEIADGGTKSFGYVGVDGTKRLVFTLKNTGSADVTGLAMTMDGPDTALFSILNPPIGPIAPGGSASFTVVFTPTSIGTKEAVLQIASNDEDEMPFDLTLTGIAAPPVPPLIEGLFADPIGSFDATVNAVVNAVGSDREVIFEYGLTTDYGTAVAANPAVINGDASMTVQAGLTGLLPRTVYHFRVRASGDLGAATSPDMTFMTVNRPPVAVVDEAIVLPGGAVAIAVLGNDSDPDGDALRVAAFTKPIPANDGKLTQVGDAFVFTASQTFAGATFSYTVDDGYGGSATAVVQVFPGFCTIDPAAMAVAAEGGAYDIAITSNGGWTVDERLSWVAVEPESGFGDGMVRVTISPHNSANLRVQAINIGGQLHTITQAGARTRGQPIGAASLTATAATLPPELIGTYHGLVERNPLLNGDLGARLDLTTTSGGSFSGKLTSGADTKSFTGVLAFDANLALGSSVVAIPVRAPGSLTLELVFDPKVHALGGRLADSSGNATPVNGWQNAWDGSTLKAAAYAAPYAFTLKSVSGDPLAATASGDGSFTIDAAAGTLLITGRLSDNSIFTGSTFVGQQGQVLVYQPLHLNTGSLAGVLIVTPGAQVIDNIIGGAASWFAPASAGRARQQSPGFGLVGLAASGAAQAPQQQR